MKPVLGSPKMLFVYDKLANRNWKYSLEEEVFFDNTDKT